MRIPALMKTILRVVVTTLAGGLIGALFGALLVATPIYFDNSRAWIGRVSDWAPLGVFIGYINSAPVGMIIGLIAGIAKPTRQASILIGAVPGLALMICLLSQWDSHLLFAESISVQLVILLSVITGTISRVFDKLPARLKTMVEAGQ